MASPQLQEILRAFEQCCRSSNLLHQQIFENVQYWDKGILDCCESINGDLDIIIDILEDWAADYTVIYSDFICQQEDSENIIYEVIFENYLCQ